MIIQGFFKFHDFPCMEPFLVIFQVFHDFQNLWEPCIKHMSHENLWAMKICKLWKFVRHENLQALKTYEPWKLVSHENLWDLKTC